MNRDHHPACPGGCGELADECRCARPAPLGSMRVVDPFDGYGHAPCCPHDAMENGHCTDCLDTGHAHRDIDEPQPGPGEYAAECCASGSCEVCAPHRHRDLSR